MLTGKQLKNESRKIPLPLINELNIPGGIQGGVPCTESLFLWLQISFCFFPQGPLLSPWCEISMDAVAMVPGEVR